MELTKSEKVMLSLIACDNDSGNHLLRERSDEYWQMQKEWAEAAKAESPTEKQTMILEYVHQCTDYAYYHSLPTEKRMF